METQNVYNSDGYQAPPMLRNGFVSFVAQR